VTLTLSVPVEAPGGEAGALAAYVDFAPLAESLQALAGGEYALRVGDTAGTTLADTGALAEETLGLELTLGDWSVSVREPAAGLEERLAAFRRQTWLWVALAAAIALALSLSLSAWITRPIGRLRRAADELARGNLQARAGLARRDEIGALAGAFDRMAAALGELDQAKSDFVAHVSHELRTPLTSMKLSVANLLDGVVGELDARQRTALERVERELERLIALVNRLLELARLEAGALRPTLEPVELLPLAREVAGSLAALAEERGVALEISGEGTVRADRGMLQRVLLNLVDNALKFSPRGTRVRVELGGRGLRVRDQGPGLGPALVFQAFRPGAQPGVPHAGAGLGLAIVKKLIELQGGSVRAENAPGGGALLTVELPEVQ
jgi:signal transduction histidine kinase